MFGEHVRQWEKRPRVFRVSKAYIENYRVGGYNPDDTSVEGAGVCAKKKEEFTQCQEARASLVCP